MLADETLLPQAAPACRLADARDEIQAARDLGLAENEISEVVRFLRERVGDGSLIEMLDRPFRPRAPSPYPYGNAGRFHDGRSPCLYTAIEAETAKAEMQHHAPARFARTDGVPRVVHFKLVWMAFSGKVFDVRGRAAAWPDLIGPTSASYPFCQRVAAEARERKADGLLTPSARHTGGTCLPVFRREAVANPSLTDILTFLV